VVAMQGFEGHIGLWALAKRMVTKYCGDGKYNGLVIVEKAFVDLENIWTQVIITHRSTQNAPPG
jgi:hypothetical protein